MKTLKKSLCIVLSFLMVFSTIVFFYPVKADASNIPEFAYGDYYYYPEGTRFIYDLALVQGEYVVTGLASNKADRKAVSDNTKAQLTNFGYTIVGSADIGDGTTQMTANLTQRKDEPKNWKIFTFLGYKTTTDITQAVTSIRARHENNTSYSWYVDGIRYNIIEPYELNKGNDGDYIYLYESNDPTAGLPITSIRISNTNDNINANAWAGNDQLVLDGNGNVSDLNNGASDTTWIYMAYGNNGVFQKISQSVVKALYDQIVRYLNLGTANSATVEKYNTARNIYNSFDNSYKAGKYTEAQIKTATTALKTAIDNNTVPDTPIYPSGYNFSTDRYNFYNINEKIALEYYIGLYKAIKGTELYNYRGERKKHGHCFGMATSTAATLINAPYVTDYISWTGLPYTKLSSVNKGTMNIDMDISAKDYIKYCHIYQDSAFVCIQRNSANHKGIQNVYNAVKHAVLSNTDCTLIVIDLWGGSGGHTVYAAGIDGNDILVNDSNAPGSIQRIKINGNNWSYSAAGLNWNSSVNATIDYVENCIEPYLRLTMGIDVEGGNVPKNNSNSYSYTEESEINGTYSYTSTVIEPIDTDKLLVVSENDNFSFDESESMYKLNSTDGTAEENANGLYWLDENNTINAVNTSDTTATIKLVGNELKITAEMPADSSTEMTIDENEKNEASFRLKEEENISFTFTTLDENNEFVNIVITGTADTTEVTANQTDTGMLITGISDGTVTLSVNDEEIAKQNISSDKNHNIEINYDINDKDDNLEIEYTHSCSDKNNDGICDICGAGSTKNCSCMCHSNSFAQFIHKILCFFYKLFGMNDYRYCDCGKAHW